MRILHTADWHLGKRLEKFSRFDEQISVLNEICEIADEQKVDVVLVAGDLFDTFNPPTEAIELFYQTLRRLTKNGERAVVAIAGNHDSADRIAAPDPLARACGIILVGHPDTIVPQFKLETGLEITKADQGFIELKLPHQTQKLRLILTPYVNELRLKKALDTEDKELEFRTILSTKWQELADKYCDSKGVNILMTHLFFVKKGEAINESEESDDEKSILYVGGAQAIYSENIPKNIQYVALGHLHRKQTIDDNPCPIVYSSSPLSYSFSEANQKKYVIIIDAEPKKKVKIKEIVLKKGRKLLRNTFSDIDEAIGWLNENQNSLVELTIETPDFLTSVEKRQLLDAHEGIVSIIPKILDKNDTSKSYQKIDLTKDVDQLFIDFFQYKNNGQRPNQALIDLFKELQGL